MTLLKKLPVNVEKKILLQISTYSKYRWHFNWDAYYAIKSHEF
jgi:hypothetical protein